MGNKTGWIIAGIIVLGVLGIVAIVLLFPPHSRPRPTSATLKEGFMDEMAIDASLALVTGAEPTGSGNAGDDYKAAFEARKQHEAALAAFDKQLNRSEYDEKLNKSVMGMTKLLKGELTPPADVLDALKVIAGHVQAGAGKGNFDYTFKHTPKTFEVGYQYVGTIEMQKVYIAMARLMWYHLGLKEYDKAIEIQEDLIVMGRHLANEGVRLHMTEMGLGIQSESAAALIDIYGRAAKEHKQAAKEYEDKIPPLKKYRRAVNVTQARVNSVKRLFSSRTIPVGDILHIADNHKDRAVRVQAILFLGRLRFEVAGRRGDIRETRKLIEQYADSSDPFEAAAAKAAADLTEDGWKGLYERELKMN